MGGARSLGGRAFEDLIIPMYIIAADIYTGDEIVFDSGPLADAIRASLSVPLIDETLYSKVTLGSATYQNQVLQILDPTAIYEYASNLLNMFWQSAGTTEHQLT